VRRCRTDETIKEAVRNEQRRLEAEYAELRARLEGRHEGELKDLQDMVEQSRMRKMEAD
jgi:hypothetical protein